MLAARRLVLILFVLVGTASPRPRPSALAQQSSTSARNIPKTWDDEAIATLEIPLADPVGSPRHVSADYYYRIPVAPIYKSYPIYVPGYEPPGYVDWLKQQEPEILWDDSGQAPPLQTDQDWIKAGEIVFGAAVRFGGAALLENVRNPSWYEETRTPHAEDGTLPIFRYVIAQKGVIEVGQFACAYCHSRLMSDGSVLNGAQGNFPLVASVRWDSAQGLWAQILRSSSARLLVCRGSTQIRPQAFMAGRLQQSVSLSA